MSSTNGQMIKDFLGRFSSPKEHPEALRVLGTSERLGELFWAALSIVSEDGMTVVGLPKLATKLKMPSSYLTAVKHQGLLESGNKRGVWLISQTAIKKMARLLSDETVAQKEKDTVVAPKNKGGRKGKKTGPRKGTQTTVKSPLGKAAEKSIKSLGDYLTRLSRDIQEKQTEQKRILDLLQQLAHGESI